MTKNKKGFTIIEVVLVLAIAGLIFLMVFIALPALQRSQRNTQREDDISRFLTAANDYQTNNNGKIPFIGPNETNATNFVSGVHKNFVSRYIDKSCKAGATAGTYTDCESEFTDPDGEIYSMVALKEGTNDQEGTAVFDTSAEFPNSHKIQAVVNATCGDENMAVKGTGKRQYALFYMLEGNSVTCNDNH